MITMPRIKDITWSAEVNLGTVLQLIAIAVGAAAFVVASASRTVEGQRQFELYRSDMKAELATVHTAIAGLQADVRAVPTRIDNLERVQQAQGARMDGVEKDVSGLKATTAAILGRLPRGSGL